jgi:endonuclease/exonuclease/phosphatase family metal-dependent hydrolase
MRVCSLITNDSRQTDHAMRIATLNIWHRSNPWNERKSAIVHELEALQPDVIGMQEVLAPVDPSAAGDQAKELAGDLGYEIVYAPACVWGGVTYFGNAILTRYPIATASFEPLPGHANESRSYVHAMLESPHGVVPIFVTHLAWRPEDVATRIAQACFLKQRIDEQVPRTTEFLPVIVMGDLNAEPHSEEIRILTEDFVDSWATAGDGSDGFTWDRQNEYTHEHDVHSQRIDYILVRRPLEPLRLTKTALAFNRRHEGVWPSDHFGLVADFDASSG